MPVESTAEIAEVYQPLPGGSFKVIGQDGSVLWVPNSEGNRHFEIVDEWLQSNSLNVEVYAPSLSEAKAKRIAENKAKAWNLLFRTDWYDIRAAAGGAPTPVNIAAYRQDVRDASNQAETQINALTTVNNVRDYIFNWPVVP